MNNKRIQLLILTFISGVCVGLLPGEQLLKNGSFEHNLKSDGDSANWPIADYWSYFGNSGGVENTSFTSNAQDGQWRGWVGNNTSGMSQVTDYTWAGNKTYTLSFYVNAKGADRGFVGQLFYWDGTTAVDIPGWVLTVTTSDADHGVWELGSAEFVTEVSAAYIGKPIGLRLTGYNAFQGVDNVILDTDLLVEAVTPANHAIRVPLDATIQWQLTPGVTFTPSKQTFYFRTGDPNWAEPGTVVIDPASSPYDPELDFETTYYWRVDTFEPNAPGPDIIHTGPTWSFATESPKPEIIAQPVGATIPAGGSVELSVAGINLAGYQWYFSPDSTPSPATDTALGTGTTQIVDDLQLEKEGWYYCVVDNGQGDRATSTLARLMIRRLVGWWQFEGNLADAIQDVVPGAPQHDGFMVLDGVAAGDPNFTDGVSAGTSALVQYDDGEILQIADSTDYFNFYPIGLTVSAWVKSAQVGWGGIVAKQHRNATPYEGFLLNKNGTALPLLSMRDPADGSSQTATGTTVVSDDMWHLVIGSYDPIKGQIRIFTDGILEAEVTGLTKVYAETANPLVFGRESLDTGAYFSGLLDDIRIWNYALSDAEIGQIYVDVMGGEVCVEIPELDFNEDCTVDIADFAIFAATWLDCGISPASECQ